MGSVKGPGVERKGAPDPESANPIQCSGSPADLPEVCYPHMPGDILEAHSGAPQDSFVRMERLYTRRSALTPSGVFGQCRGSTDQTRALPALPLSPPTEGAPDPHRSQNWRTPSPVPPASVATASAPPFSCHAPLVQSSLSHIFSSQGVTPTPNTSESLGVTTNSQHFCTTQGNHCHWAGALFKKMKI